MKNKEFKLGDHILVQGNRGTVESITNMVEYNAKYDGKDLRNYVLSDEQANNMLIKGYELTATGRTATYFKVNFDSEELLKNTGYNHGTYGCIDEYEMYGTW